MDRAEFLSRNKSPKTLDNYRKALKKLDSFLELKGLKEDQLVEQIKTEETAKRYKILQEIINHIQSQVSARVTKEYFNTIYAYFLLKDLPLDERQRRLRLDFPRSSKPRFEGLDKPTIEMIYRMNISDRFSAYISLGHGAGLRETEALLVTPRMFEFSTVTRLKLPGAITKFNIPRETFLPEIPAQRIKNVIDKYDLGYDDLITIEEYDPKSSLVDMELYFSRIRSKAGLDTKDRKKYQQNDITLHSFRSFFDTVFKDNNLEWFGGAIMGHSKYMDTYYRKSLDERIKTFEKVAPFLNF